ncbi:MAG: hypothetical protein WBC73_08135 [Phormidesmis sp.]
MADLIIPATLRTWLVFLLIFVLLGYPVLFSIVFGAIGGLAGGLTTGWWQIKGGAPSGPKEDALEERELAPRRRGPENMASRWELPFLMPSKAKQRYRTRKKRAQEKRMR